MTLPAKVAAAAGVIGGSSLAGCYFGGVFDDTPWVSLKTETASGSGTNPYTGKVGEKYSIYLLAVHGTEGENQNFNESKWKELHKKYLADLSAKKVESTDFGDGNVDKEHAYASSSEKTSKNKALNVVCESIYKKGVGDDQGVDFSKLSGSTSEVNKHKLARDLLRYCSALGEKPKTVEEKGDVSRYGYASGSIGEANKTTLASTAWDSGNYYFWEAQERWFLSEDAPKSDLYFKDFFTGDDNNKKLKMSLRDVCHDAYGKTPNAASSEGKPKTDDVKKYCSFQAIV